MIPFADKDLSILIINSNVKHNLADSQYAARRKQCLAAAKSLSVSSLRDVSMDLLLAKRSDLSDLEFQRARHIITENVRTTKMVDAIERNDWQVAGDLLYESHRSLRDDYDVSCNELDLLVDLAKKIGEDGGVYGSRMTGGGFGGCTVSIIKSDLENRICQSILPQYQEATGRIATAFVTRPAHGAELLFEGSAIL